MAIVSRDHDPDRARAVVPGQAETGITARIIEDIHACTGDADFMMSLARGLAVLSTFTRGSRELTMARISRETGIPRAAVRRVLYTLSRLGYVGKQGRGFVLLPRMLALSTAYLASSGLSALAQPVLDQLRDTLHESCSMGILDGDDVLYVARAETVRIMSIGLRAGSRLPAYCTSMGRVLLAALPQATLQAYLQRTPLRPRTGRTVTSRARLVEILDRVRKRGCALVDQELELGLRSVAVAVKDRHGRTIGALNVGTQSGTVPLATLESMILPELRRAADTLQSMGA